LRAWLIATVIGGEVCPFSFNSNRSERMLVGFVSDVFYNPHWTVDRCRSFLNNLRVFTLVICRSVSEPCREYEAAIVLLRGICDV